MPLKVIGAGFGRTGTMSLQAALQHLGLRCYHMTEVPTHRVHARSWHDFLVRGIPMDWATLFENYDATVDFPACLFYGELMREFPDARVILSVRDHDAWFSSWLRLRDMVDGFRRYSWVPPIRRFYELERAMVDRFLAGGRDPVGTVNAKRGHEEEVRRVVPPARLLVFDVRDGWEPLCEFLGAPVPENVPFPHLNEGTATLRRFFYRNIIRRAFAALCAAALVGAAFAWMCADGA